MTKEKPNKKEKGNLKKLHRAIHVATEDCTVLLMTALTISS